jgi:hypothetical protein
MLSNEITRLDHEFPGGVGDPKKYEVMAVISV